MFWHHIEIRFGPSSPQTRACALRVLSEKYAYFQYISNDTLVSYIAFLRMYHVMFRSRKQLTDITGHQVSVYPAWEMTSTAKHCKVTALFNGLFTLVHGDQIELAFCPIKIEIYTYWKPTIIENKINKNLEYNVNKFIDVFDNVVQRHLLSDVSLGVLLSGGIDSSLVTAFAAKHRPNIKTFVVTFPGFNKYNESSHAKIVADHFSTDHIEIEAKMIDPQKLLPKLAKQYDEPIIDSSMIPSFLVCQEVSKHCKLL